MYDESGFDYVPQASGGNVFTDFFSAARDKLSTVLAPATAPSSGPSIGSQLFEAVYQYGAGKVDAAREKAVGAFLMTTEGKKVQSEGIRQTAMQYWPMLAVGAVLLIAAGFALRR